MNITAIVVPKVTCDLPIHPVPFNSKWNHLRDLALADPEFGTPGRIDVLLGIDIFVEALRHGRRKGPPGSPIALETMFGWVLCGNAESDIVQSSVATHHALVESGDDILRKFWEIEESPTKISNLSMEERTVLRHFESNHFRNKVGRFVVPLPKRSDAKTLGESRSQAVRRFLSLERSLNVKGQFIEFEAVMKEYTDLQHAEIVPVNDLEKPQHMVFYLPMHAVYKQSSSTTKVRAVFDASAKSSSGVSLNDTLLVGPTVHPPLVDVLLRFRLHRVALTADVSKMYRAVELTNDDKDLHRFVWRSNPSEPLKDYRMTRLTFGISASSFAANMAIKQNAINLAHEYPQASEMVEECFYVDDCLTGADNNEDAIKLHHQLQALLSRGGFHLRKWNSSELAVLKRIDPGVRDSYEVLTISGSKEYAKTLGFEWNTTFDHFRLTVNNLSTPETITKRVLVSDIAKIFDVLGWFSPTVIKMKMLLQRLWESNIDWDESVPTFIKETWLQWISELPSLKGCHVPRYYFPKDVTITSLQLHGFCDASENAYAGVVYLRGEDSEGRIHISIVTAKTRVSPIKRLTIPRLELCGAYLLTQLLHHVKEVYRMPLSNVFAWTDSTIVLNWLTGTSRRFKTYVGNRVSYIVDCIPPNHWRHVNSTENPADCASRGLFPSELVSNELWWKGPKWLYLETSRWPGREEIPRVEVSEEEREISLLTTCELVLPVIPVDRYSTFPQLQRVTAWIYRFINNCCGGRNSTTNHPYLTVAELSHAENYWLSYSQLESFPSDIASLKSNCKLPSNSKLISLNPFIDSSRIMRVGGRLGNSKLPYTRLHPIVLHAKHTITKLILRSEHIRLLHAGPTLMISSICLRFHIINLRKAVRSITRQCVICRRHAGETLTQLQGQLPSERVTPGTVFETVGVDYAGPVYIKHGYVRKPTVVKAYICVFVSLTVKAVHLELVSDLTSEAFIAALRRFVARRGYPNLIWSDHGTNFVGANHELKKLFEFLKTEIAQCKISEFCASRSIEWKFIPERAPHFGGLWEAAVKSMKTHLRRVITPDVKLTFEEMTTVIVQIEACLNSRPLIPVNFVNDCVTDILTPGHFLVGQSLTTLPDNPSSSISLTLKHRWHLCQNLTHHFWRRWSTDYLTTLNKFYKWSHPTRNVSVGDIVILRDEATFPTKWPIAKVVEIHRGNDNLVRVVTLKTAKGIYKRPIHKIVLLIPTNSKEL